MYNDIIKRFVGISKIYVLRIKKEVQRCGLEFVMMINYGVKKHKKS